MNAEALEVEEEADAINVLGAQGHIHSGGLIHKADRAFGWVLAVLAVEEQPAVRSGDAQA